MAGSDQYLTGRIALQLGFLKPEHLAEAVALQQKSAQSLGEILVARGYLTTPQLNEVLAIQQKRFDAIDPVTRRRKEAVLFGKLAVREGYVSEGEVNDCLRIQGDPAETRSLGEILVDRGYLTSRQVYELLAKQIKRIMICAPCGLRFTVTTLSEGKDVPCPRCKNPLETSPLGGPVRSDADLETKILRAPEPPTPVTRSRLIQTVCVICDARIEASLGADGRVLCPECRSSFLPS